MPQMLSLSAAARPRDRVEPRPRTLESYVGEWQAISPDSGMPWPDVTVNSTACVFGEFVAGSMLGGLYFRCFEDLGAVICYARYYVLPNEGHASSVSSPLASDALHAARGQLDALLRRFVAEGYCPQLKEEFTRICNMRLRERQIGPVYTLPYDLPTVLETFGNPLVADEDEDQRKGHPAPVFDPENPAHWAALQRRIDTYNGIA